MKRASIILCVAMSLTLALFITACGTSTGSGPYGVNSNSSTTPTATTGSASALTIKTASLTIGGKSLTVLTNAQGLTLYYRTSDTSTSVCSGGCASTWPPVLSSSTPGASASLPGTLSLLNDANGSQVAYNGHPLYTYSGDSAPGQANGQGVGNVWFVVTSNLPVSNSTPSGNTPTPGGYQYP